MKLMFGFDSSSPSTCQYPIYKSWILKYLPPVKQSNMSAILWNGYESLSLSLYKCIYVMEIYIKLDFPFVFRTNTTCDVHRLVDRLGKFCDNICLVSSPIVCLCFGEILYGAGIIWWSPVWMICFTKWVFSKSCREEANVSLLSLSVLIKAVVSSCDNPFYYTKIPIVFLIFQVSKFCHESVVHLAIFCSILLRYIIISSWIVKFDFKNCCWF